MQEQEKEKKGPSKALIIAAAAAVLLILIGIGIYAAFFWNKKEESVVYKETEVAHGKLTVGITESGNVEVGETTQEFTLDISAYSGTQNTQNVFSWAGGMPGMANQGGQSQSGSSSESRNLTVEEVYVSVGEEIREGDPIYRLSAESVEKIREELAEDVTEAKLDLKQMQTQLKQTSLSAQHDYETDMTYGAAAQLEYGETLADLNQTYEDAAEALSDAQEELAKLQEEEAELQEKLKESTHLYDEAAYLVTYIDLEDDPYGYISAIQLRDTTEQTKESDEDALEEKQDAITEKQEEIASLQRKLTQAEKEKRSGEIKAQAEYDARVLRLNQASELYNLTVGIGKQDVGEAEDAYTEAQEKLDELNACIQNDCVVSEYSGVITEVSMAVGDSLSRGASLIALKDYGEAEITVSVEDDDIDKIKIGDQVNISIAAFPDEAFTGTVSEIGDAVVDTYSSTITYEVTVSIEGDVEGIYSGMTSEVTFITKETKEVTYVLNRAINRDGTRSFVYLYDENGNVVEKDVQTGFSDGINVEITDGLVEGDVVLIESKVSEG